jgi:hypothetical protein
VQKTSEDALQRGLEAQCSAVAAQARVPVAIKPRVFWPKTRLPAVTRYEFEGWFYLCTFLSVFVLTRYFAMQAGGEAKRGCRLPHRLLPA